MFIHRHPSVTHICHFPDFFTHSDLCLYFMLPLCEHAMDHVTVLNSSTSPVHTLPTLLLSACLHPIPLVLQGSLSSLLVEFPCLPSQDTFVFPSFSLSVIFCLNLILQQLRIKQSAYYLAIIL